MTIPEWLDIALKIGSVLCALAGAVAAGATWIARNALVTKEDLDKRFAQHDEDHKEMEGRLDEGDRRLGDIEAELRHLPTAKDITSIVDRIAKVQGEVTSVAVQVQGVGEQVARVDKTLSMLVEFHIKEGKK